MTSSTQRTALPPSISLARKLMYGLAALSVIGTLITLVDLDTVRESATGDVDADTLVAATVASAVVITVISVVLWLLLARFLGRGKNWARIVATVLAALGVVGSLFSLGGTAVTAIVGVITLVVYIALIVVLWRKDATAFLHSGGAAHQGVAEPGYPQV